MFKREFVILGVVSLTMGNSPLPLAHRPVGHMQPLPQFLLGQLHLFALRGDQAADLFVVHSRTSLSVPNIPDPARFCNRPEVELAQKSVL